MVTRFGGLDGKLSSRSDVKRDSFRTMQKHISNALAALLLCTTPAFAPAQTWTPDNGDGTFTNPLFYEEFSDPDMIRVGDDFYLTGTTMHSMPGLPVLHSKDLVNWELKSYAMQRL